MTSFCVWSECTDNFTRETVKRGVAYRVRPTLFGFGFRDFLFVSLGVARPIDVLGLMRLRTVLSLLESALDLLL
jgi:hypothetical protein